MARGPAEDLSPAARAALTGCRVTVHGTVEGLVHVSDSPLFFTLGARRTGMLTTLVMLGLIAGLLLAARKLPALTEAVLRSATSGWAAAAGFLTALALMALSGVVSVRLYERRSP